MKKTILVGLVALLACVWNPSLSARTPGSGDLVTTSYLKITGVAGEVTEPKFEDQIEVLSYSGTTTGGPGELSITKNIDASSPALFLLVATGNLSKAATLTVVQTIDGQVVSSLRIDMRTVLVTSVAHGGDTESVTFSFLDSKVRTKKGGLIDSDPVTDLYLDINGIVGDVTDPGFEGQIEVLSYSWTETSGPGELTLTKLIDSSSPDLFALVVSGSLLKTVRLTAAYSVDGAIYARTTIELRDVFVTSVVHGFDTETITLSFQRSKVTQ